MQLWIAAPVVILAMILLALAHSKNKPFPETDPQKLDNANLVRRIRFEHDRLSRGIAGLHKHERPHERGILRFDSVKVPFEQWRLRCSTYISKLEQELEHRKFSAATVAASTDPATNVAVSLLIEAETQSGLSKEEAAEKVTATFETWVKLNCDAHWNSGEFVCSFADFYAKKTRNA